MRRPNTSYPNDRRRPNLAAKRPFWLPASNYYVLSVAISIGCFFLVWGILHDEGEETPWITSGISASILLSGAVILREVVLRQARLRQYRLQRKIDANFAGMGRHLGDRRRSRSKLTLEQNAAILSAIKQKSNAAKVLNKFSAGHREVFELCGEYIARNEEELKTVAAGSPRFGALLKGRTAAAGYHRYHLLRWAEIEARHLVNEANSGTVVAEKLKAANDAIAVIEYALASYPAEESLLGSKEVIRELIISIRVSDTVERAEHAAFRHNYREAISLYRDALFYLGRDNLNTEERKLAAERVNSEIERLRLLEGGD